MISLSRQYLGSAGQKLRSFHQSVGSFSARFFNLTPLSFRQRPFVSVIVPVYNEPEGIRDTLTSLILQSYPEDRYEILAVDNGSTDDTRAVITAFAEEYDHVSLVVEDNRQGSYAARNAGIRASSGEFFAFLDADEIVDKDWLERCVRRMVADDVAYMGCDVELFASEDEESLASRYNRAAGFPVEADIRAHGFAPTCCLWVRRSVLKDVGPFDSRLESGGDLEFGNRVQEAGYELHYAPEVTVYHPARSSLRSLVKKSLRQGRGVGQLQRHYPDRYGRLGIPPAPNGAELEEMEDDPVSSADRIRFAAVFATMVALKGIGYYSEVLRSLFRA